MAVAIQSQAFLKQAVNIASKDKRRILNLLKTKILVLSMIFALLLTSAISTTTVTAQSDATVIVQASTDGTTDVTGTTTYADGATVTINAMSDAGFVFSSWVVSPSDGSGDMVMYDNPLVFTVTGGVTYTVIPVFIIPSSIPGRTLPTDLSTAAIVVVLPSAGGTTMPPPGTYAMANAEALDLTAMPSNGWQFSHWTIYGVDTGHGAAPANFNPTDNPYNVNHGYGATYSYQAIFVPVGSTEPTPTPTPTPAETIGGMSTETWIIIALIVVIVVILIGFGIYASRSKR